MKFLKFFALATTLMWHTGLRAEIIAITEAIEANDIKIIVNSRGSGYVLARGCADCPFTRLEMDRKTAITVDGKPAEISKRIEKHWSGGIVIYDIKTNHVARLKL